MAVFQTLVGLLKVAFVDGSGVITGIPGVELSDATSGEILAGTAGLNVAPASVAQLAAFRVATVDGSDVLVLALPTVTSPDNLALNAHVQVDANSTYSLDVVPAAYEDKFFHLCVTFENTSGSSVTLTAAAAGVGAPATHIPAGANPVTLAAGGFVDIHCYHNPVSGRAVWVAFETEAV